jgi:hypothetical protein
LAASGEFSEFEGTGEFGECGKTTGEWCACAVSQVGSQSVRQSVSQSVRHTAGRTDSRTGDSRGRRWRGIRTHTWSRTARRLKEKNIGGDCRSWRDRGWKASVHSVGAVYLRDGGEGGAQEDF